MMKIKIELVIPDSADYTAAEVNKGFTDYIWDTVPEAKSVHVEVEEDDVVEVEQETNQEINQEANREIAIALAGLRDLILDAPRARLGSDKAERMRNAAAVLNELDKLDLDS